MIKLQDIGTFSELPELAMYIYTGDITALRVARIKAGILKKRYV